MAIKLGSAIGLQKETTPLDGLGELIGNKAGGIADAYGKKKALEQKERDLALKESLKITQADIDALPEDVETYRKNAAKYAADLKNMYVNKAPASDIMLKQQEAYNDLSEQKRQYEADKKDLISLGKLRDADKELLSKDFSEADDYANGIVRSSTTTPAPMVAPNREMPVNKEDADITETTDIVESNPYFKMTAKERAKYAPEGFYTESTKRIKDVSGNFGDAATSYFGKNWNPTEEYATVVNIQNPGGLDKQEVRIDKESISRDKNAFLSSYGTKLGGRETELYWKTLTNKAAKAARDMRLYGEEADKYIKESVLKVAGNDFDRNIQSAIEQKKVEKIDLDPDKESKGQNISFTAGGGAMGKVWNIGDPETKELMVANKEGKPTDKKIGDYDYFSIQTVGGSENPKWMAIGKYGSAQVNAVWRNRKNGKVEWVDISLPPDDMGNSQRKHVRIDDTEVNRIRTNIGAKQYDGSIGNWKPTKQKNSPSEERTFKGVKYSLTELKEMAKKAGKTDKEAESLWKTLK